MDELRFDDQVVVITGARRGIGKAYAEVLAARGAKLVLNALGPLGELVADLEGRFGAQVAALEGDAGDGAICHGLVDLAISRFGRIDAVISNAGGGALTPIDAPEDLFAHQLQVDTVGPFILSRAVWPYMKAQGYGRILLTTSTVGVYGMAQMAHYAAAKGAIVGLASALGHEGAPDGIKVNAIAPNATTVGATSGVGVTNADPWRAMCTAEVVAPAGALLVHRDCPVNGELINAGGGRVARIFFGNTAGFHDSALTMESLLANWDRVEAQEGYFVPGDAMESGNVWARKNAGF